MYRLTLDVDGDVKVQYIIPVVDTYEEYESAERDGHLPVMRHEIEGPMDGAGLDSLLKLAVGAL